MNPIRRNPGRAGAQELEIFRRAGRIENRIGEMAVEISRDYQTKDLLILCVLKGAFVFAADLVRALKIPWRIEFVQIESYGANTSSSAERIKIGRLDLEALENKDILILEDIVDSGRSMARLREALKTAARPPKSIRIAALIDKRARRSEKSVVVDYPGFLCEDARFLIGYGLDYDEQYRGLPDIGYLPANPS